MTAQNIDIALREYWGRQLVELVGDLICVCVDGEIAFMNTAGARILGAVAPSVLIGRRLNEILDPAFVDVIESDLEDHDTVTVPLILQRLDGESVQAEVSVRLLSQGDALPALLIHARDISERTSAADSLLRSEERLRGIMDSVAEGIFSADEDGMLLSLNPAAEQLFLLDGGRLSGRHLFDVIEGLCASIEDCVGVTRECFARQDGVLVPIEMTLSQLRQGPDRLFIGVARDITERKRAEDALMKARDELEARVDQRTSELRHLSHQNDQILNSAGEGIMGINRRGKVTFVNPAAAEMLGDEVDALVGAPIGEVLGGTAGARQIEILRILRQGMAVRRHREDRSHEMEIRRRDGHSFTIEFASAPIEDEDGLSGFVVVFHDVTERKRVEEKLRLAATVFETTAEAIMVLDSDYVVTAVNPAFTEITGYSRDDVTDQPPKFIDSGENDESFYAAMWKSVREAGRWEGEQWNLRKDGSRYAERLAITSVTDDNGEVAQYVVVFSDVTQRKKDEERIRYQANFDALTGLPNRSLFLDRLSQAVVTARRSKQRVGLMFIDLDGFKLVNDTLGHHVGDDLLKEAATRLQDCVRMGDTVARLGGDEFTVIMPDLGNDSHNSSVIASRIIEALERPMRLAGEDAYVSASIGITSFPDDANDTETLLKNADAAMYRAKEQGKANFQYFTSDMNAQVRERVVLKNGLIRALERDEFALHYQPKLCLSSGRVTGVEALLRWQAAELGRVPPVRFIPVLEESGLVISVGEWTLEVACAQHRAWADAGHPGIRVAVNLSVRQLRQPGFAKMVERKLVAAGIEPAGLELEITESMIMRDTENAVATLRELNGLGIHLAMDDFGTGYSSLSYLKRFPLDTIKIDQSFVSDIATDSEDLEIIRTIISMGHSLRRRIVAEGVETAQQRQLLEVLGCDEIQGYLISRPVPAPEIAAFLARNQASELKLEGAQ